VIAYTWRKGIRGKKKQENVRIGEKKEEERRLTCPPSLASTVAVSPLSLMILAVNLIV